MEKGNSGFRQMEDTASATIHEQNETARIDAEHAAAIEAANAQKVAEEAALEEAKAAKRAEAVQEKRATERAAAAKSKAIETRSNSSEVSELNDQAELAIYGNRSREYKDADGNVVADAKNPMKGRIEDLRTNPKYGRTPEERNLKADSYAAALDQLTRTNTKTVTRYRKDTPKGAPLEVKEVIEPGEGLELCQAKLVLDLREEDLAHEANLIAQYITQGMDASEAKNKVQKLYDEKDRQRIALIKSEGIFSPLDYVKVLRGIDLYSSTPGTRVEPAPVDPFSKPPTGSAALPNPFNRPPTGPAALPNPFASDPDPSTRVEMPAPNAKAGNVEPKLAQEIAEAQEALVAAKTAYAEVLAEQRNAHLGKAEMGHGRLGRLVAKLKGKLHLDRRDKAMDARVEAARDAYNKAYGAVLKGIDAAGMKESWDEGQRMARQVQDFVDLENEVLEQQQVQAEQKLGKTGKWIAEQFGKRGRLGKILIVGSVPLVAGAAAGFAAATFLSGGLIPAAAALTGYAGKKFGHGVASRANLGLAQTEKGMALHNARVKQTKDALTATVLTNGDESIVDHTAHITADTVEAVTMNKSRRAKAGAVAGALAAVGFGIGNYAGNRLDLMDKHGKKGAGDVANNDGTKKTNDIPQNNTRGGSRAGEKVVGGDHGNGGGDLTPDLGSTGSEKAFPVVKGGGIYEQLQTGLGLSPEDARKASRLLNDAGFFNGDKIAGIGHTANGQIIPYLRGAGDGFFHFPPEAIKLLTDNGITVA